VLAGKNSIINENISGSVIISDITNDAIIADTSNKLYINFENGIDIAGNVVVNDDLLINDNAGLYLDQNSSGIFSGDVGFFGDLDLNSNLTIKNNKNLYLATGSSGIFSGNLNIAGALDLNTNLTIKSATQFSTHSNSTSNFSGVVNTLGNLNSASLNIGNNRIIFDNEGININSGLALNMTGGALSINGGSLLLQEDSVTDFYGPVNFWGEVSGTDVIDFTKIVTLTGNQIINGQKSFANQTIFLDRLFIKNGDAINGTKDYPYNSEDDGAKGQIEFLDNNLFLYNNGRWVKFIGNNGAWDEFNNSNIGSLQKRQIDYGGGVTDGNIISWDNGVLSYTLGGDNQITSFPEFGANGSLFVPTSLGEVQVLEWQNGLITTEGHFEGALNGNVTGFGNGKSGLFKLNNQSIISWNNGLVTNTGTFERSLIIGDVIYTSGSQNISGSKTFLSGAIFQRTQDQLTFRTGDAGSLIKISAPSIIGSKTYTIPDVNIDASFVMTQGGQSISGINNFLSPTIFQATGVFQSTTNQLSFRTGQFGSAINISAPLISGSRVYTIPDIGGNASFVMTNGNQTISGQKNFDKIPTVNVSGQFLIVSTGVFYSEQSFSFVDEYGALQTKIFLCR
jgi:hypothetical protein